MGLFSRIFGEKEPEPAKEPEHGVIVQFQYGKPDLEALFALEDRMEAAIKRDGVGEMDGHDVAVDLSDGGYYMYGPDADRLFETIRPILEQTDFMQGATVTLRYGPVDSGAKEVEKRIGVR